MTLSALMRTILKEKNQNRAHAVVLLVEVSHKVPRMNFRKIRGKKCLRLSRNQTHLIKAVKVAKTAL